MLIANTYWKFSLCAGTVSSFTGLANLILITVLWSRYFYKPRNTGAERLTDWPKVSQPEGDRARIATPGSSDPGVPLGCAGPGFSDQNRRLVTDDEFRTGLALEEFEFSVVPFPVTSLDCSLLWINVKEYQPQKRRVNYIPSWLIN